MQAPADSGPLVGMGAIFTLIVVTLGPIKILGPFAQGTQGIDRPVVRQIAFRAFLFSLIAVLLSGVSGLVLLQKWHISIPSLEIAGGIIFLIVGLRIVLEQYQATHEAVAPLTGNPTAAALRLAFPSIVTPYGIAAVMVLLARSHNSERTTVIVGILTVVMLLNLAAMLGANRIMNGITILILRIVGSVLGVLQVALAVEMILISLRQLGVVSG